MKSPVIKQQRPLAVMGLLLILVILVLFGGWFALNQHHWRLIHSQMAQTHDTQQLREAGQSLEQENRKLREQLTKLRASSRIDTSATATLQNEVIRLQDEIYRLTREIEFYRGIVSATKDSDGLQVEGVLVEPTRVAGNYRFKLVLTHVGKNGKVTSGVAQVFLEGDMGGTAKRLSLPEVATDSSLELKYKFKNFKRFETYIELPADFVPSRVLVKLIPEGNANAPVERTFNWSDVTS